MLMPKPQKTIEDLRDTLHGLDVVYVDHLDYRRYLLEAAEYLKKRGIYEATSFYDETQAQKIIRQVFICQRLLYTCFLQFYQPILPV